MRLVRVGAPHFVAGFLSDGRVKIAAPILQYLLGQDDAAVRAYCLKKGWRASVVAEEA